MISEARLALGTENDVLTLHGIVGSLVLFTGFHTEFFGEGGGGGNYVSRPLGGCGGMLPR